ncbi:MAG: ATP-binding protein [Candidatus Acidiferrales bacterium]|jgi:hypothetical protein
MPRNIPLEEVFAILQSGNFLPLIGGLEDEYLECKGAPYRLSEDAEKMEIAKDISALANAAGGVLLLGVTTERDLTLRADAIRSFGCFKQQTLSFEQCEKIAAEWIIPPVRNLKFHWYPQAENPAKGIVSITVPPDANIDRPYIVCKALLVSGKVAGSFVGYFERTRDSAPPMRGAEIRERLKDGLRFSEMSPRIANIEQMIANLSSLSIKAEPTFVDPENPEPTTNVLSEAELEGRFRPIFERVRNALRAFSAETVATFSLVAWPLNHVSFPGLFESNSNPVVRLLANPPQLRAHGFSIATEAPPNIIAGNLRRCLRPDFRLLEVWRDGTLIAVVEGDEGHLCWATSQMKVPEMQINSIALAETCYTFCDWALKTFQHAEPNPTKIQFRILLSDMNCRGTSFALNNQPLTRATFRYAGRLAPGPAGRHFYVEADATDPAAVVAYRLLAEVYAWFGFNADEMPYGDRSVEPHRLDLVKLTSTS